MIHQISTFFVGRSLRDTDKDIEALDELEILVCGWVFLASEGRLSRIEEFEEVEDGEEKYKSLADRLKGFMDKCMSKGGVDTWDFDNLTDLNYDIWKVVHEVDELDERSMGLSG